MKVNASGVIANSFPKSGTHILTELLEQLEYMPSRIHLSRSLLVYGPRNIIRNAKVYLREDKSGDGIPIDIENKRKKVKEAWFKNHVQNHLPNGTYCQAHLPYSDNLENLLAKYSLKMIYIHRHPLDVLVSLKNYILKKKNHPNHQQLFDCINDTMRFKLLLNGYDEGKNVNLIAPFFQKYQHSILWSKSKEVCSITFEDIIGSKGGGCDERQEQAVLKVLEHLGYKESIAPQLASKIYNPKSATFHKGIIGQWHQELTSELLVICKQKMKETKFDEHFAI